MGKQTTALSAPKFNTLHCRHFRRKTPPSAERRTGAWVYVHFCFYAANSESQDVRNAHVVNVLTTRPVEDCQSKVPVRMSMEKAKAQSLQNGAAASTGPTRISNGTVNGSLTAAAEGATSSAALKDLFKIVMCIVSGALFGFAAEKARGRWVGKYGWLKPAGSCYYDNFVYQLTSLCYSQVFTLSFNTHQYLFQLWFRTRCTSTSLLCSKHFYLLSLQVQY